MFNENLITTARARIIAVKNTNTDDMNFLMDLTTFYFESDFQWLNPSSYPLWLLTTYSVIDMKKKFIWKGIIINQDHFVQTWYKIYEPNSVKNKY